MPRKISDFTSAMLSAWENAVKEPEYLVDCGEGETGRKAAVRLRFRLYELRQVYDAERPDYAALLRRIQIRLRKDNGRWYLQFDQLDKDLDKLITGAGADETLPELE